MVCLNFRPRSKQQSLTHARTTPVTERLAGRAARVALIAYQTMPEADLLEYHAAAAAKAKELYVQTLVTEAGRQFWREALKEARRSIFGALKASNCLLDVTNSLLKDGGHMLV